MKVILKKIKLFFRFSGRGFLFLLSSKFLKETKSNSIDFFNKDKSLLSPEMEKYLEVSDNKENYINEFILKKKNKESDVEENVDDLVSA